MNLHKEFVKLSFDIIKMKNKLISLLLEIYEKEIYKQCHCQTIHEYGFKYAKLSREMVDKAIRTLKHLENKPLLKQVIETHGIHKVAMVATIATPENEGIFAKHVENLSKPALFEFSKELRRRQQNEKVSDQEAMFPGQTKDPSTSDPEIPQFCQAVPAKITIELDPEMQILFLKFKGKYAKNLSNREALRVMLREMDRAGDDVKGREAVTNMPVKAGEISVPGNGNRKHHEGANNIKPMSEIRFPSRHIQKKKSMEIRAKYQHKCAYPGCVKTVEVMHHRIPFAFERSHESIIPLCDVHHEFAHNGLITHELLEPENWRLKTERRTSIFDQFYLKNRRV